MLLLVYAMAFAAAHVGADEFITAHVSHYEDYVGDSYWKYKDWRTISFEK